MTVQLDHTIVTSRNKVAAAKQLAELLGVPWAEKGMGPFSAVYVNDGLTHRYGRGFSCLSFVLSRRAE